MNELSEILEKNALFIEDKYVETILKLVHSLREKEYSISTTALINYFTILPEYNIFNLDEMIITMKGLFSGNEQQYKEVDFYIREFFFNEANINTSKFMEKNEIKVIEALKSLNNEDDINLDNISIRTTAKETDTANKLKDITEILDSILKETDTEKLRPFLELNQEEMIKELADKDNRDNINKGFNKIMIHNISSINNPTINEVCVVSSKKTRSLTAKIDKEKSLKGKDLRDLRKSLKEVEKVFTKEHRLEFEKGKNAVRTLNDILDKDISDLNWDERENVSEYIKQNVNKFKTKISRTMKIAKNKQLDFRKTIQESVKTYGDTVHLYYKKPTIKKTKLVCILDISGSARDKSSLFLRFIYELSSLFRGGTKSYVFVKELGEITEYMTNYAFDDGIGLALKSIRTRDYSDYNTALKSFNQTHLGEVDKSTIVIFLGDARNNKNETGLEYLSAIKKKCKHLIWLNSEEKSDWNSGDSIIGIYKPFIDELFQITTVNELTRFLSDLKLD